MAIAVDLWCPKSMSATWAFEEKIHLKNEVMIMRRQWLPFKVFPLGDQRGIALLTVLVILLLLTFVGTVAVLT